MIMIITKIFKKEKPKKPTWKKRAKIYQVTDGTTLIGMNEYERTKVNRTRINKKNQTKLTLK